jgi:hypothetical protein
MGPRETLLICPGTIVFVVEGRSNLSRLDGFVHVAFTEAATGALPEARSSASIDGVAESPLVAME